MIERRFSAFFALFAMCLSSISGAYAHTTPADNGVATLQHESSEDASQQPFQTPKALASLHKIKKTLDAALEGSTDGLWPRSEALYEAAQKGLAQLYLHAEKHKSPITTSCMAYVEELLEAVADLPPHKIYRNGADIMKWSNMTIVNLQNVVTETTADPDSKNTSLEPLELDDYDKQMQNKATQVTLFIHKGFLPPVAIHSNNTSWLANAKEGISDFVEENPILCTVAATATVVAIAMYFYNRNTPQKPPKQPKPDDQDSDAEGLPLGDDDATRAARRAAEEAALAARRAAEEAALAQQAQTAVNKVNARQAATQGENAGQYTLDVIQVERQHGSTCTYHAVSNTVATAEQLEKARYDEAVSQGKIDADQVGQALQNVHTAQAALDALRTTKEKAIKAAKQTDSTLKAKKEEVTKLKTLIQTTKQQQSTNLQNEPKTTSFFQGLLSLFKGSKTSRIADLTNKITAATARLAALEAELAALPPEGTSATDANHEAQIQTAQATLANNLAALAPLREAIIQTALAPERVIQILREISSTALPSRADIETAKADFIRKQEQVLRKKQIALRKAQQTYRNKETEFRNAPDFDAELLPSQLETLADQLRTAQMYATNQADLVTRLKTREDISEEEANLFVNFLIAKKGFTAQTLSLLRPHQAGTNGPDSVFNNAGLEYLCGTLEYGQNSGDYEALQEYTALANNMDPQAQTETLAPLRVAMRERLRRKIKNNGELGEVTCPSLEEDADVTIQETGKRIQALKSAKELAKLQFHNAYPKFVAAIQAGKPAIYATHSPHQHHWTSQIYLPDQAKPTRMTVRHMDSCGMQLSRAAQCMVHDGLSFKVPAPSQENLEDDNGINDEIALKIRDAFDCEKILEEVPSNTPIPHIQDVRETYPDGSVKRFNPATGDLLPKGSTEGRANFIMQQVGATPPPLRLPAAP